MRPRPRPLDATTLARLPGDCAQCLTWELGLAPPAGAARGAPRGQPREDPPNDPLARKRQWVTTVLDAGATPGVHISDGERVVAWASFAPARHYARRVADVPIVSPDALLLALALVAPSERGRGLGRALVLAALRETVRLDADGLEAYGDHRWRDRGCVLPVTWLLARGFVVHRPHPRTPLLRIDARRVVHWAESIEAALDALVARVPRLSPEPRRAPLGQGALGGEGPRHPAVLPADPSGPRR